MSATIEVMLPNDWPNKFRRTIQVRGVSRLVEFDPGVAKALTKAEYEALQSDIGRALQPVYRDDKGRPRLASSEVEQEVPENEPS